MKILPLTVALVLLGGCRTSDVKLYSVAQPEAEKAIAFRIQPGNATLDPDSLAYREAERFVKTALSGKGLYEAPSPEMADMLVSLDYGISAPIPTVVARSDSRYSVEPGLSVPVRQEIGSDGNGGFIYGTVMVPPAAPTLKPGKVSTYSVTVITYVKHLRLTAENSQNPANGQPPREIWRVDVTSEGENRDLRKALPVLAAATIEFIGKDTSGEKTIKLKDADKDGPIAFVKKGL